jgi:hypothetical protein
MIVSVALDKKIGASRSRSTSPNKPKRRSRWTPRWTLGL